VLLFDPRMEAMAVGDVHVGRDKTAAIDGNSAHLEYATVRALSLKQVWFPLSGQGHAGRNLLIDITGTVLAAEGIETEDLVKACAYSN